MKKVTFCFVFCMLMFCITAASYASLSKFTGYWKNVDPNTGGVTKIKILASGTDITVQAWGKCQPRDCDWGTVKAYAYGPNVSANLSTQARAITAVFTSGFSQVLMVIEPYGRDRLEVNVYDHFTDNSRRTDYSSKYIFTKSQTRWSFNKSIYRNRGYTRKPKPVSSPVVKKAVACRGIRGNKPWGEMGKAGTLGSGPLNVYRFITFENVGGRHKLKLRAYLNGKYHSTRQHDFYHKSPNTPYDIWLSDVRTDGNWKEYIILDGKRIGEITYYLGWGGD